MYHISKKYLGTNPVLKPTIPSSAWEYKEGNIPRVCFAPTLFKCIRGITGSREPYTFDVWLEFNGCSNGCNKDGPANTYKNPSVYTPIDKTKLYIPPNASDFRHNDEHWAITDIEVKLRCYLSLSALLENRIVMTKDAISIIDNFDKFKDIPFKNIIRKE